jgi:ABC-type ATPase with predicted acetyltransferase domain
MVKDMQYLLKRTIQSKELPQGGGGILSQQRTNAAILAEVMRKRDLSLGQIVNYLQRSPDKLSDEDWVQLHKVYRKPKPTYMKGLTDSADAFIKRRSGIIKKKQGKQVSRNTRSVDAIVQISDLGLSVNCKPIATVRGRRVQEAFGIVSSELCTTLINGLDVSLKRSEVVLVGGPSGTGKSLFLKSLRWLSAKGVLKGRLPKTVSVKGELATPSVHVSWPKPVPQAKAPVELLEDYTLEESLQILAAAGLAEAQLFVRPSGTLSVGQAYRLSLALAIAEKPDLLLIDEFCEPLDRFTMVAVAKNIKKAAQIYGMSIVVATADPTRVKDALRPDKVLLLSSSGHAKWVSTSALGE